MEFFRRFWKKMMKDDGGSLSWPRERFERLKLSF